MKQQTAAIFYAPDGYDINRKQIMGRASAGNGFLRAAAKAHAGEQIFGYTHVEKFSKHFHQSILEIEPTARPEWAHPTNIQLLKDIGVVFRPDSVLTMQASTRMRFGINTWSLCGVTHTISTQRPMEAIAEYLTAPLFPWDAMICTSKAVVSVVEGVLAQQADYNKWRFGGNIQHGRLQLPIIPLGVHCDDFAFTTEDKTSARSILNIPEDAIVCLFVGRLSFYEKAHPIAMYAACEAVAKSSGKPIVLIECGWYGNSHLEAAYDQSVREVCPSISHIKVDGQNYVAKNQAWAAADIFISLSDNIQETFGLTPIEAMAVGLPVLATDWDGYRDTIRHNVDGFLVPTIMTGKPVGGDLATRFETEIDPYGHYCGKAAMHVSVDHAALYDALYSLVMRPELRARLGANGRQRAREVYEWSVVFKQYQSLWADLCRIRISEGQKIPAPPHAHMSSKQDPFAAFASYPSQILNGDDRLMLGQCKLPFATLLNNPMIQFAGEIVPNEAACMAVISRVANAKPSMSVNEITIALNHPGHKVQRLIMWLMKFDYLRLHRVP